MKKPERILVIRLGALGDLVLCFQAFSEIRDAHPDAEIALLTMPAFADFAKSMPWFDKIFIDERAPAWHLIKWWKLLRQINKFAPTRIYDLQGKLRQTILYILRGGFLRGEWSGAAPLCSHPRLWPPQPLMHYTDFVSEQLRRAHVASKPAIDLAWLDAKLDGFNVSEKFVVLIPGCAPGRQYKRWPATHYAALADSLKIMNISTILAGTLADKDVIGSIRILAPHTSDFTGRTNLLQLAAIMRKSLAVVGNDTGPTHLAAVLDVPTVALMSEQVNAVWSAPHGSCVTVLKGAPLAHLGPEKVLLALQGLLDKTH